jgi:hypothetical protein
MVLDAKCLAQYETQSQSKVPHGTVSLLFYCAGLAFGKPRAI